LGSLESVSPSGHVLRVVLEQAADRVGHRIEVLVPRVADSPSILAELRSLEGTSHELWPPSPPLQSCSLQEIRPGQIAAFLVGMAGKSHWSASIEAVPSQGVVVFDVACRVPQMPDWLGSTYSPSAAGMEDQHSRQLQSPVAILRLGKVALSLSVAPAGDAAPPAMNLTSEGGLQIACCLDAPVLRPTTFRWRYSVRIGQAP
jgi:hypothetical protein